MDTSIRQPIAFIAGTFFISWKGVPIVSSLRQASSYPYLMDRGDRSIPLMVTISSMSDNQLIFKSFTRRAFLPFRTDRGTPGQFKVNKTMFTNFLDTPFPVDVEIGEPIL
jgi:hypothetical protein